MWEWALACECVSAIACSATLFLSQQSDLLRFYAFFIYFFCHSTGSLPLSRSLHIFISKPPLPHVVCRGHIKLEIRLHMVHTRRSMVERGGYVVCDGCVRSQQAAIEIKSIFAIHFILYRPWVWIVALVAAVVVFAYVRCRLAYVSFRTLE